MGKGEERPQRKNCHGKMMLFINYSFEIIYATVHIIKVSKICRTKIYILACLKMYIKVIQNYLDVFNVDQILG